MNAIWSRFVTTIFPASASSSAAILCLPMSASVRIYSPEKIACRTTCDKRPLCGKDQVGIAVGEVLGRFKMAKYLELKIEEQRFSYKRDLANIEAEAQLDSSLYILRTSVPEAEMNAEETMCAYKGLSEVEYAFRSMKTVDLKVYPIHHRIEGRVRAHVLLCMLAYYAEWHMKRALAPMLFFDDDPGGGEAQRTSVVAPARRSKEALRKRGQKRTRDGFCVHSFQTLLDDLAIVTVDTVRYRLDDAPTVERVTFPTPSQERIFDLLGVSPAP